MIKPLYPSLRIIVVLAVVTIAILMACKEKNDGTVKQTILEGEATVYVDESLQYIVEDQETVFESQYNGRLTLINKTESEIVNLMLTGKSNLAVLSRRLTAEEENYFTNKKITPKVTHFASDAVVFVTGSTSQDTLIDLQQAIHLLQGKPSTIKSLVFENPNSGTVSYMKRLAGVQDVKNPNIFFLKSDKEVIDFIAKNPASIGVISLSPMLQPYPETKAAIAKLTMMAVRNVKSAPNNKLYYKPTQHNLGEGLYPLKRSIYLLNYQGFSGLGMGFASFVAGDIGQRIVLKSELLPVRIPERNINIRKENYEQ